MQSDEYPERQKIESNGLVGAVGSFVALVSLAPRYEAGEPFASVIWMIFLVLFVSDRLVYLGTTRNETALKIRMALEKRRRSKRIRERELPDVSGSKIKEQDRSDLEVRRVKDG